MLHRLSCWTNSTNTRKRQAEPTTRSARLLEPIGEHVIATCAAHPAYAQPAAETADPYFAGVERIEDDAHELSKWKIIVEGKGRHGGA
jgi:alkanesulfonate monooxygenase SsuD/methylene tetrahydromethanopterin reductase-like flavin-dependent oxidoreductase (luciferase family)